MENDPFVPQNEQQAWVGILFACMASDLKLPDVETDTLVQTITKKEIFKSVMILPVYRDVMYAHSKLGSKGLMELCISKIKDAYKLTLFAVACEIVSADGNEHALENDILSHLAGLLNIPADMKQKIKEVITIKNKGNTIISN
ncbi:MAG: TerB family tellurite resistance protein [Chitinophagales bacterium]|nr:TerB family tellurite resistance protein [Chitinophagales bacterium]